MKLGAGKMVQKLKVLTTLAKYPGLVLSTKMERSQLLVILVPKGLSPPSGLHGTKNAYGA